jgi:soluble lytic murein transglycosylase-like protein
LDNKCLPLFAVAQIENNMAPPWVRRHPKTVAVPGLPIGNRWCKEISTFPNNGLERGLPAKLFLPLTGMALVAAALCGCTSTGAVAPTQSFTETAAAAGTDAGFQLALPEQVSVLPQPSGRKPDPAATQIAMQADPAAEAKPAAFAGPTPQGSAATAAVAAQAQPATTDQAAAPVAAPVPAEKPQTVAATAPDLSKVFPAAPEPPSEADVKVASIEPISYTGPVPVYLAPPRPLASKNAFADTSAPRGRGDIEKLIEKYSALYEVPVELVRHVVNRESTFNPKAYNHGHWGLMQIKHQTARGMGYQGPASGLFDAETNLKYAVKYLRGAWLVAGRDQKRADWLYQTGYYYEAKRKGLLEATGLGVDRKRRGVQDEEVRLDPEGLVKPPVLPVGFSG